MDGIDPRCIGKEDANTRQRTSLRCHPLSRTNRFSLRAFPPDRIAKVPYGANVARFCRAASRLRQVRSSLRGAVVAPQGLAVPVAGVRGISAPEQGIVDRRKSYTGDRWFTRPFHIRGVKFLGNIPNTHLPTYTQSKCIRISID